MAAAAILDLFEPEIAPFDPPSPKTHPRTKHEVYRITRCGDVAIRVLGAYGTPFLGGAGGRSSDISVSKIVGGQRWHHLKERRWFPV